MKTLYTLHTPTLEEECFIHKCASGEEKHMRVRLCRVGHPCPFWGDVERVTISRPIGLVLVHPIMIIPEKVRVEDELIIGLPSHPIEHGIEFTFAHSW